VTCSWGSRRDIDHKVSNVSVVYLYIWFGLAAVVELYIGACINGWLSLSLICYTASLYSFLIHEHMTKLTRFATR